MRQPKSLFTNANDLRRLLAPPTTTTPVYARWEWFFLVAVVLLSLALGLPNLGVPSLWHDELVHLYVAKHITAHGWPALPSGNLYPSSTAYNYVLAAFVGLFGDSATAARMPSVLLGGLNTALVYLLCRRWLGRPAAVAAAVLFATSPWQVAWARQARLYEFQITSYLLLLYAAWHYYTGPRNRARWYGLGAIGAYLTGVLTSFHSILYLGPVGLFGLGLGQIERLRDRRWIWAVAVCTILGGITLLCFWLNPNPVDRAAVFQTGIGGRLLDQLRTDRYYYFRFLANNLSVGFFVLAVAGGLSLLAKRDRSSLWILLGFLVPVLILTFLVGYRRFRFMFFAYPFYVMICAHGLVVAIAAIRAWRRSFLHGILAAVLLIFMVRLAGSTVFLLRDSVETASGAHTTLAIRHPQWKKPAAWVKENLQPEDAVLTTTFLPVYHYVGHVDNWFPNRYTRWEYQESGLEGLDSLEALRSFLRKHPQGYYLAESSRFTMWRWHGDLVDSLGEEVDWVETHMTLMEEASSDDVQVWRWDFGHDPTGFLP